MERIYASFFESPIGTLQIASTERGICCILLPRESTADLVAWLSRRFPSYQLIPDANFNRPAIVELEEYFAGERMRFDVRLDLYGTPFQRRVWEELTRIPFGETRSYQDIATSIGNPKACRAVGLANHANPVPIIVPCHRVIGKDGSLTGYGGGLEVKETLLRLEGLRLGKPLAGQRMAERQRGR